MAIQPYLDFNGRCDEAIAFYREALGAEVTGLMRFKDSPQPPSPGCLPAGCEEKVMHAALRVGDATLFASDGRCRGTPRFEGISLNLLVKSDADAQATFSRLAEGGQIQMPIGPTFFASSFGMVQDRFGVSWMVLAGMKQA